MAAPCDRQLQRPVRHTRHSPAAEAGAGVSGPQAERGGTSPRHRQAPRLPPAERAWLTSEYNSLLRALDWTVAAPRRFVDLWLEAHPGAPDLWSWTKPKRARNPKERRIDLMLLAGDGRTLPLAMARDFLAHGVVADGRPVGHLSDHAALIAEFAWPLPQAAPDPRRVAELQP
jgi:hypothetical protein